LSYATDKQTDKQTDSKILPTPTDIAGVGNEKLEACMLMCSDFGERHCWQYPCWGHDRISYEGLLVYSRMLL